MSLKDRLKQRILLIMLCLLLLLGVGTVYFATLLERNAEMTSLALKHQIVEQTLASYLARAETEMSFIAKELMAQNYAEGQELDLLFSHHEVLFSGGLDFFYIVWKDNRIAMDPRARLFTQVSFTPLLEKALLNRWTAVFTEDDEVLLQYKKKIVSATGESLGFLYGYISLNDNLTLGNELLTSVEVTGVRLYDVTDWRVLLDEKTSNDGEQVFATLTYSFPLATAVQGDFLLEVEQREASGRKIFVLVWPLLGFIIVCLVAFNWLVNFYINKLIFVSLEQTVYRKKEAKTHFKELQPIEEQSKQYRAAIKAKGDQFDLLAESVHSAIIFCNEVAELQVLNKEAKEIFPEAERARTLFDFLPIAYHQSIQEALKGAVGRSFEMTIDRLGRIYQWRAFSYHNEYGYRGILLVGRNITKETSLMWQLDQLQPLSSAVEKQVDTQTLQGELAYLTQLPTYIKTAQFQGWLSLTLSVLDDIRTLDDEVEYCIFGDLLTQESASVMKAMSVEGNRALLEVPLSVASGTLPVDRNIRALVRLIFMMVLSNDLAERRLTMQAKANELEIVAMHDMANRSLFMWMVKALASNLGAQYKILRNNALQFNLPVAWYEQSDVSVAQETLSQERITQDKLVAWVANDYQNPELISDALQRLGCKVKKFVSADSFFTESSTIVKYDAIFIGCDQDTSGQKKMTQTLQVKHDRQALPIVWVNSVFSEVKPSEVFQLQGCPFDYSLYQILLRALERDGVMPLYQPNTESSWLMVGGSRVTKAIWYNELERQHIATQWLTDLSSYDLVLPYHPEAVIVLLTPQSNDLLTELITAFPKVSIFTIQDWQHRPDNVALVRLQSPHSDEQINHFIRSIHERNRANWRNGRGSGSHQAVDGES
ncbi:hypothetical protein [Marinomonas sp. THO17]|uniref:hypothetical protein n=1 Tax=Marinomonas sp. THO17 TaxID=3149048 RepID=UPI00336BD703